MTFSSYAVDVAPPGSLVVALSQSGKVTRVIEGVRAARARGLVTLAVTARPDSPLAAEAVDCVIVVPFPKLGAIPGTTSFTVGSIALSEVACALVPGNDSDELRRAIDEMPATIDDAVAAAWDVAIAQAARATRATTLLALAGGPDVGRSAPSRAQSARDEPAHRDMAGDRGVRPRRVFAGVEFIHGDAVRTRMTAQSPGPSKSRTTCTGWA